ncbi:MAG: GTPase Era [Rhodospirillales bacterium]|nr:GTPase Era [Rhodospirillales bacterium]
MSDREQNTQDPARRCGFVAVLGAPNAGKSTLVNRLIGAKVSIVSPKAQTTRARIAGIAVTGAIQTVYLDLPGVFAPRRRLDRAMVDAAWRGAGDADFVLLVVDAKRGFDDETAQIVAALRDRGIAAGLVVNKIDLIKRPPLLDLVATLNREGAFTDTFLVSAATGDGTADLKRAIEARLPAGPWHYPEDQLTDISERLLAAEVTREQAFLQLHQELPYALAVETEKWEDFADGSARIEQTIYVQRDGQRKIVIGEKGAKVKAIGAAARAELARILGRNIHLFLHVKVAENWGEKRDFYRTWGLEYDV